MTLFLIIRKVRVMMWSGGSTSQTRMLINQGTDHGSWRETRKTVVCPLKCISAPRLAAVAGYPRPRSVPTSTATQANIPTLEEIRLLLGLCCAGGRYGQARVLSRSPSYDREKHGDAIDD